ncbi:MAG: hypothetical protein IJ297_03190 [Clostridia bacterium]|nr:hypothetical protein [Clostridia bacterium]
MATSWKSQQGKGEYSLQFETDDKEKYKLVEKAAQMAVDGKTVSDVVEVVRCKDCKYYMDGTVIGLCLETTQKKVLATDFCSYGIRKEGEK